MEYEFNTIKSDKYLSLESALELCNAVFKASEKRKKKIKKIPHVFDELDNLFDKKRKL